MIFKLVAKTVSSSSLSITTEVEVFNAANVWLTYNIGERSIYSKVLLLNIHLHLLRESASKHILRNSTSFLKHSECVALINKVLRKQINNIYDKVFFIRTDVAINTVKTF